MIRLLAIISWGTILAGALMSALGAALVLLVLAQERRPVILACLIAASALSPGGWNAVLRATHASNFFTDAPLPPFPVSWQDFGSGVFTFGGAALVAGAGPLRSAAAGRVVKLAALCALAAFLVDIYLY